MWSAKVAKPMDAVNGAAAESVFRTNCTNACLWRDQKFICLVPFASQSLLQTRHLACFVFLFSCYTSRALVRCKQAVVPKDVMNAAGSGACASEHSTGSSPERSSVDSSGQEGWRHHSGNAAPGRPILSHPPRNHPCEPLTLCFAVVHFCMHPCSPIAGVQHGRIQAYSGLVPVVA